MKKLVENYCELPPLVRKPLWKFCHYLIQKLDKEKTSVFLNYGYKSENGSFKAPLLSPQDQPDRYGIQLYQYVTQNQPLEAREVLEVGCGRGGGASWLTRTRKPKSYTALDISKSAIDFCKKKYQLSGLSFVLGEAEDLPFSAGSFDILVNIESARCYGRIDAFFREAFRVLQPGGIFLFADMIKQQDREQVMQGLLLAGFAILESENITENVVLALRADSKNRKTVIDRGSPAFLRTAFYEFAGVEGTNRFDAFDQDEIQYWRFILKKNQS